MNITYYKRKQGHAIARATYLHNLAIKIAENFEKTKSMTNNQMRVANTNERSAVCSPMDPTKSTDSVYRRLGRIERSCQNPGSEFWNIGLYVTSRTHMLIDKIENRTMGRSEYRELERTSDKKLLLKWKEEISG